MDPKNQLDGLDRFLSATYGSGTNLIGLLASLGFDSAQLASLQQHHLSPISSGLVDAIHDRLTGGGGARHLVSPACEALRPGWRAA